MVRAYLVRSDATQHSYVFTSSGDVSLHRWYTREDRIPL